MSVRIGLVLLDGVNPSNLRLAKQIGADEICTCPPREGYKNTAWDYMQVLNLKNRIVEAGLDWTVVETLQVSDTIKLGLPGRDEEIDALCKSIQSLGAAGVPTAVYTWSAAFGWVRTSTTTPVRGGAQATSYDHAQMLDAPLTDAGVIAEERLWENLEYFLKAVIPVAEKANVRLAMHPDDPPLSPIRGVGRIMTSPENFQRLIDLVPSPSNGMTFCQGCFFEMGVDVPATIKHFVAQDKVLFAHFRNLTGTATKFTEQFHDDGDADMVAIMQAFYESGYEGAMRPDHVPTMEGDGEGYAGYTVLGRLFAVGYMRGLMHAIERLR